MIKNNRYLGYYFVIGAAALSSLVHVVSKPMLEMGGNSIEINPIVMTFLVYMICGIFFTPIARKTDSIRKFSQKDIAFMAIIGLSEVAALAVYFFGLQNSSAVNASIFSNSEIVFSLIIAMVVFKERLNIKECIPFSMIVVGMMVIPIGNDLLTNGMSIQNIVTGDLLIILSGFLYALDITICKYIGDKYDSRRVTQVTSFVCALVALFAIMLFQIPMDFEISHIPSIAVIAILGTGLSTLLFLAGLRKIGAVRTILLYSTTSVFGILFAGIFLAEEITLIDAISISITLVGIFFLRNKLAEAESDESPPNLVQNSKPRELETFHISKPRELETFHISKPRELETFHISKPRELETFHISKPRELETFHISKPRELETFHISKPLKLLQTLNHVHKPKIYVPWVKK
ncbi:DMT family transporter [Nitrosopumilus sp.]|uniref:DMT family transporter n=1 Tax=Nitrosopumilus sp. TaxID=2024843 RepID=UPI003D0E9B5F